MGAERIQVPKYAGVGKDAYIKTLTEAGITYELKTMYSNNVAKDIVCLTSIVPGETINVQNKEVLTVYISQGPDPATTTTTESTTAPSEGGDPDETTANNNGEIGDRPLNPDEMS